MPINSLPRTSPFRLPISLLAVTALLSLTFATRAHADTRPWIHDPGRRSGPLAVHRHVGLRDRQLLSAVTLDDELVGEALLWGIDTHNRCAQVGLAFLPGFRCRNSR